MEPLGFLCHNKDGIVQEPSDPLSVRSETSNHVCGPMKGLQILLSAPDHIDAVQEIASDERTLVESEDDDDSTLQYDSNLGGENARKAVSLAAPRSGNTLRMKAQHLAEIDTSPYPKAQRLSPTGISYTATPSVHLRVVSESFLWTGGSSRRSYGGIAYIVINVVITEKMQKKIRKKMVKYGDVNIRFSEDAFFVCFPRSQDLNVFCTDLVNYKIQGLPIAQLEVAMEDGSLFPMFVQITAHPAVFLTLHNSYQKEINQPFSPQTFLMVQENTSSTLAPPVSQTVDLPRLVIELSIPNIPNNSQRIQHFTNLPLQSSWQLVNQQDFGEMQLFRHKDCSDVGFALRRDVHNVVNTGVQFVLNVSQRELFDPTAEFYGMVLGKPSVLREVQGVVSRTFGVSQYTDLVIRWSPNYVVTSPSAVVSLSFLLSNDNHLAGVKRTEVGCGWYKAVDPDGNYFHFTVPLQRSKSSPS